MSTKYTEPSQTHSGSLGAAKAGEGATGSKWMACGCQEWTECFPHLTPFHSHEDPSRYNCATGQIQAPSFPPAGEFSCGLQRWATSMISDGR